ncbi:glycosyltransferase [Nitrosomonas sp.]|uniref:glycosyltransferase n=1 Tax=Nitrosomonas sp. TaxID=42353 RepID=UPI002085E34E|nr:glycosyltransferase [Nitrosomonas sp.]GJL74126.1 MAG: glycosyl transferase [Nitrosomonas sp.]
MTGIILLGAYVVCILALFVYGVNCYYMVWRFWKTYPQVTVHMRERIDAAQSIFANAALLPHVTTQIPLYNEANVAERVIRAVAAMDYPVSKHEIQILDDSTDETGVIVDRVVASLRQSGKDIHVFRRNNRQGFKAGALAEGMRVCKGKLIAIFDSDFVPNQNYLKQMIPPLLAEDKLAFVQARWGHLNSAHSVLTQAQSIGIDGHFMIEQSGRAYNGFFMNFNGTAGVWRKKAIEDAGGWQADTLTEDMDLSYRCQLAGWHAGFLADVVVPAELPQSYTAFKSQQFRWAKGSIQTAMKLYPQVWRSQAGLTAKVQAFLHLTHYSIHPIMALLSMLTLPVLLTLDVNVPWQIMVVCMFCILVAICGPSSLYLTSQIATKAGFKKLLFLPMLMCVGVGTALSNSRAVFEALLKIKSGFVRTPKSGGSDNRVSENKELRRYRVNPPVLPLFEIVLGLYCVVSLIYYIEARQYMVGPFLLIYACGFLLVGIRSLKEAYEKDYR